MADYSAGPSMKATVALGHKLASLLQTLIELNPYSQSDWKDMYYDIEATSGTLQELQGLMGADFLKAIGSERHTKAAVTPEYVNEIESLAVKCGLIYKSIILVAQKSGFTGGSKSSIAEVRNLENLKEELLTGPIPDLSSIKSIKLVRKPSRFDNQEWFEPRIERCQDQLQWIRTGLLIHLHIYKLAQLQKGSDERNAGDFEHELIYRSSIQALRKSHVKFTKKKARKQEKAQRQWELQRREDSSETASVTSVASSTSSSSTASTAVDSEASAKGATTETKGASEAENTGKIGLRAEMNKLGQADATDENQVETKQLSDARGEKSKTPRSFTLGGPIGSDLPTFFFDWKQRIFGADDKFKTDWPSNNLEAYIRHNYSTPIKVPFGHKRLQFGLNKVIKDGQKEKSTWNSYVDLSTVTHWGINFIVEEANRYQSRERVLVAFQEYNKESTDSSILVFLSVRKEPKPVSFKDAVGRNYTLPFETCRKWENMKATIMESFNHVQVIGPHVCEGHYDLLTSNGDIILPHLWNTTVKPGAAISMRMWPETPLRAVYGPPPFLPNIHGPPGTSQHQAMQIARMRQMAQHRMAPMGHPPPPPGMRGPPPPPGPRPYFPPPPGRVVPVRPMRPVIRIRADHEISEKEDEQLKFVDFVEELEKANATTVADLLRKFTTLKDVTDDDTLGDFLDPDSDSDYDSDGSTSTSSSSHIIND